MVTGASDELILKASSAIAAVGTAHKSDAPNGPEAIRLWMTLSFGVYHVVLGSRCLNLLMPQLSEFPLITFGLRML